MKGFLNPESIAVVGASNNASKIGGMIITNLINAGFDLKNLYPINPKDDMIQGIPAYKSVLDIGKPVDLAVIVIKNALVIP